MKVRLTNKNADGKILSKGSGIDSKCKTRESAKFH